MQIRKLREAFGNQIDKDVKQLKTLRHDMLYEQSNAKTKLQREAIVIIISNILTLCLYKKEAWKKYVYVARKPSVYSLLVCV